MTVQSVSQLRRQFCKRTRILYVFGIINWMFFMELAAHQECYLLFSLVYSSFYTHFCLELKVWKVKIWLLNHDFVEIIKFLYPENVCKIFNYVIKKKYVYLFKCLCICIYICIKLWQIRNIEQNIQKLCIF